jgi:dTDP-4-dehydrorhamnose 3,5-epimerase-like enzyme
MQTLSSIFDCGIIEYNQIHNRSGNITSVENWINIPFDIKRIFYLYDVPGGTQRGGHAHKELHQLIVAASGSFNVSMNDGKNKKIVELNRPYYGLHVKPGIWSEIINFSSGAICLVLTSDKYEENDYIRDYNKFLKFRSLL